MCVGILPPRSPRPQRGAASCTGLAARDFEARLLASERVAPAQAKGRSLATRPPASRWRGAQQRRILVPVAQRQGSDDGVRPATAPAGAVLEGLGSGAQESPRSPSVPLRPSGIPRYEEEHGWGSERNGAGGSPCMQPWWFRLRATSETASSLPASPAHASPPALPAPVLPPPLGAFAPNASAQPQAEVARRSPQQWSPQQRRSPQQRSPRSELSQIYGSSDEGGCSDSDARCDAEGSSEKPSAGQPCSASGDPGEPPSDELQLRAWRLAERYIGGLQRLNDYQTRWRRRHEVWKRKKEVESARDEAPALGGSTEPFFGSEGEAHELEASIAEDEEEASSKKAPDPVAPGILRKSSTRQSKITVELGGEAGAGSDVEESDHSEAESAEEASESTSARTGSKLSVVSRDTRGAPAPEVTPRSLLAAVQRVGRRRTVTSLDDPGGGGSLPGSGSTTPCQSGKFSLARASAVIAGKLGLSDKASSAHSSTATTPSGPSGSTSLRKMMIEGGSSRKLGTHIGKSSAELSSGSDWRRFSIKDASKALQEKAHHHTLHRRPTEAEAVRLARKYHFEVADIRQGLAEFIRLDKDECGLLTREQFIQGVLERFNLSDEDELPSSVREQARRTLNSDEQVDFEAFVAWTQSMAFCGAATQRSAYEVKVRQIAKEYHVSIADVEQVWKEFVKFDSDGSGTIDQSEFLILMQKLLRCHDSHDMPSQRLQRFWRDCDTDRSGIVDFPEFLVWYMKYFLSSGENADPCTSVYRKLASERASNLEAEIEHQTMEKLARIEADSKAAMRELEQSQERNMRSYCAATSSAPVSAEEAHPQGVAPRTPSPSPGAPIRASILRTRGVNRSATTPLSFSNTVDEVKYEEA